MGIKKTIKGERYNVEDLLGRVQLFLAEVRANKLKYEVAGSVRRCCKEVGDIDLIVKESDMLKWAWLIGKLGGEPWSMGEKQIDFALDGIPINLRAANKDNWGACLMFLTGSKEFNIQTRIKAGSLGYTLNQYGVFKDGVCLAAKTEEEIFKVLELEFKKTGGKVVGKKKEEASNDVFVSNYCSLASIKEIVDAKLKDLRPKVMNCFVGDINNVAVEDTYFLSKRVSVKKKINVEELKKLCLKKQVELGVVSRIIRPKAGNIPKKILDSLDKYFILEEVWEVDVKDVEKAVNNGYFKEDEVKKCIVKDETVSLFPKTADFRADELKDVIEDVL